MPPLTSWRSWRGRVSEPIRLEHVESTKSTYLEIPVTCGMQPSAAASPTLRMAIVALLTTRLARRSPLWNGAVL
ncbi:hypothetical protein PHSY_006071 [Pseudozyma hubeiensis SY62]|uniref:Uncharacterized protein n=1 Tax=Pseudozyma hubeiensis (strain SY62) TaxID=1305764 RepID=R9PB67_PSEHS|nr:hypothetical protein PHSY_006071 [Pseudozyma hubeiensis SY62]GAC98477.1 hypothetical protein PHSY_006071 [Pseudozyma hubeiensis SY62]